MAISYGKKSVHELFTWIHFADLLNEGLIEASNDSTTYWNHEIFIQALNKGIYSAYSSTLYQRKEKQHTKKPIIHSIHQGKGNAQQHHNCTAMKWK